MAELGPRAGWIEQSEGRRPSEAPECEQDSGVGTHRELTCQEGAAGVLFVGRRLVGGWGASDRGGHAAADQLEAIVDPVRGRLRREACSVHGRHQEVRTAIACEHATGAVGAVSRRRQPDDHQPGVGVAESGDRPCPIHIVAERRALLATHALTPLDQTWARPAGHDVVVEVRQVVVQGVPFWSRGVRVLSMAPGRAGILTGLAAGVIGGLIPLLA